MAWFDAHTHLDLPAFDADRREVVAHARAAGMVGAVVCASDPGGWDRTVTLAERHGLPWTLGLHPWWEVDLSDADRDAALDALRDRPTPWGIGETGLDFHRARSPEQRRRQRHTTAAHLALARERDVPVVLHVVRAYPQLLGLLRDHPLPPAGGMVHSWSGAPELVAPALRRGLSLSFSSAVTRSPRLQEALRQVPDDRLLLETDCPDQPLVPGTRGQPLDLLALADHVATLRGQPVEQVLENTTRNARALFPDAPQNV